MGLINVLQQIFPIINHALYLWHLDKNILANYEFSFDKEEKWQKFYDNWHKILFATIKAIFEEK